MDSVPFADLWGRETPGVVVESSLQGTEVGQDWCEQEDRHDLGLRLDQPLYFDQLRRGSHPGLSCHGVVPIVRKAARDQPKVEQISNCGLA